MQPLSQINRKFFTQQRRALSSKQRQDLANQSAKHLHKLQTRLPHNAKIGLYYADFGELPTDPILRWAKGLGYTCYLPVVGSFGRARWQDPIDFCHKRLRFAPMDRVHFKNLNYPRHALGMKQAKTRNLLWAKDLDAIFVPLVAVDRHGRRIGMGGGFYDTSLAKIRKKPLKIAWCYDFQCVADFDDLGIRQNAWDVPMDFILTPQNFIHCQKKAEIDPSGIDSFHLFKNF